MRSPAWFRRPGPCCAPAGSRPGEPGAHLPPAIQRRLRGGGRPRPAGAPRRRGPGCGCTFWPNPTRAAPCAVASWTSRPGSSAPPRPLSCAPRPCSGPLRRRGAPGPPLCDGTLTVALCRRATCWSPPGPASQPHRRNSRRPGGGAPSPPWFPGLQRHWPWSGEQSGGDGAAPALRQPARRSGHPAPALRSARDRVALLWHPSQDADPGHRWLRALIRDTCARPLSHRGHRHPLIRVRQRLHHWPLWPERPEAPFTTPSHRHTRGLGTIGGSPPAGRDHGPSERGGSHCGQKILSPASAFLYGRIIAYKMHTPGAPARCTPSETARYRPRHRHRRGYAA